MSLKQIAIYRIFAFVTNNYHYLLFAQLLLQMYLPRNGPLLAAFRAPGEDGQGPSQNSPGIISQSPDGECRGNHLPSVIRRLGCQTVQGTVREPVIVILIIYLSNKLLIKILFIEASIA